MNTQLITSSFISNGFSRESHADFFRENNGFINCVNFQIKTTGDVLFINLGVHPMFDQLDHRPYPKKEIDCYIRSRLSTNKTLSIALLDSPDDVSFVINEIEEKARTFFDFFSSIDDVFSLLSIDNIKEKNIATPLNGVTPVRLVSMCMHYHILKNNINVARDFANYGVSISGMAVSLKKAFKQILRDTEDND